MQRWNSIKSYLVSWTAFSDDNIASQTAHRNTVRIHQRSIVLPNITDAEQEIALTVKHLKTTRHFKRQNNNSPLTAVLQ